MNLVIPNPPLKIEKASVKGTDPDIPLLFDTSRQIRTWIWGIDSKKGSEKKIEYISRR